MLKTVYAGAFSALKEKPVKLWGISILYVFLSSVLGLAFGIPVLSLAVSLLLATSMNFIFLMGYQKREVKAAYLFKTFEDNATMKRVVGGLLWMVLWIFLWSLIPVVGPIFAIIRTYEYSLTPYILINQPEVKATDAIKVSSEKTDGYKGSMFLADIVPGLVIFGVVLVVGIILAILWAIAMMVGGEVLRIVAIVFTVVLGLAVAVVLLVVGIIYPLFVGLYKAAFYQEIVGEAAANQSYFYEPSGSKGDATV